MKILVVTQYYPPEPIPIPYSVAHALAERGHEVRVITGFPNYPEGRLVDGYRQRLRDVSQDGGVEVRRVPILISHSENPIGRVLNYLSFGFNSLLGSKWAREADVIYVYATQMTAAIGADWWRILFRVPYVMHVQDLWPESVTGSSLVGGRTLGRVANRVLNPWLKMLYRRAAFTIGIGPRMSSLLVSRGVPQRRSRTVLNWAPTVPVAIDSSEVDIAMSRRRGVNVTYAGNIGDMQDLETVVRAAAEVTDLPDFCVTIIGSGMAEKSIRSLARHLNLDNVIFRGRVPHSRMAEIYRSSDFQLVTLKDLDIFRATLPSKFQASLAFGLPVITTVAGDVAEFVTKNRVGFASPPGDVAALARSFRSAHQSSKAERSDMGKRAKELYSREMAMDKGIDAIEAILSSVVLDRRRVDASG